MPRRKKIRKKSYGQRLLILVLVALVLVGIFHFWALINKQLSSVPFWPYHEKKIPQEIKSNLNPNYRPIYKVPILVYHYVEYVTDKKDAIRQSLNIEPYAFERQVKTLKDNGYTFMTAGELGQVFDGKRQMPNKPVLLTFDDGHWDVDTVVLPILKKYHAKGTVYVITGFINGSDFLSDKQIQHLINSGAVEIGTHTVHHANLKGALLPLVEYEVNQSKKAIEDKHHVDVASFAYPDGAFDQQTIEIVKQAGYTTAVSTIPGIIQSGQNRYFLFRLRPGYRSGKDLLNYFNQTQFKAY